MLTLVTGAARGIGAATARRLAAEGALVAVNDIDDSADLRRVVKETAGLPAVGDVADPAQVRALVAAVEREAGPVEALVSNAAFMAMGRFDEQDATTWWRHLDVNLTGTFHLVREVLPGMHRLGRGRIVIVSSEWGVTGWPNATGYAASKAGLISLTKTLARELAPEGILVNAIAPGVTDTPQLEVDARDAGVAVEEIRARYAAETPAGRIGRPEEVAATVAFLVSDRAGAFVGQILQPNGGTTRGET
jgi:NAD(P)-dependent dehydrogenase (short-subunit alcohol dehydrogenase family)